MAVNEFPTGDGMKFDIDSSLADQKNQMRKDAASHLSTRVWRPAAAPVSAESFLLNDAAAAGQWKIWHTLQPMVHGLRHICH